VLLITQDGGLGKGALQRCAEQCLGRCNTQSRGFLSPNFEKEAYPTPKQILLQNQNMGQTALCCHSVGVTWVQVL
jgi:hypothetical protein